jgi:hypothetical protein
MRVRTISKYVIKIKKHNIVLMHGAHFEADATQQIKFEHVYFAPEKDRYR